MRHRLVLSALAASLIAAPVAAEVPREHFVADDLNDVVLLCTTTEADPLHTAAVNFCHGFLVGAYTAHQTEHSGPGAVKIVCMPEPAPTRSEGIQMFIDWAKAHPEYAKESPIEALFKFLIEKWPCPQPAAAEGGE